MRNRLEAFRRLRDAGCTRWQALKLVWAGPLPLAGGSGIRFDFTNKLVIRPSVSPQSIVGTTVNGVAVDTQDLIGDVGLEVSVGANGTSVDAKLQQSDVSGSGFADLSPAAAIAQVTTASLVAPVLKCLPTKRFVKAVVVTVGTAVVTANILGFKKAQ